MPSLVLHIAPGQAKLIEHRFKKAGPDFFLAVLQRREPLPVIQATMAAFAMTAIE
jgi:hypothetical protein